VPKIVNIGSTFFQLWKIKQATVLLRHGLDALGEHQPPPRQAIQYAF